MIELVEFLEVGTTIITRCHTYSIVGGALTEGAKIALVKGMGD